MSQLVTMIISSCNRIKTKYRKPASLVTPELMAPVQYVMAKLTEPFLCQVKIREKRLAHMQILSVHTLLKVREAVRRVKCGVLKFFPQLVVEMKTTQYFHVMLVWDYLFRCFQKSNNSCPTSMPLLLCQSGYCIQLVFIQIIRKFSCSPNLYSI